MPKVAWFLVTVLPVLLAGSAAILGLFGTGPIDSKADATGPESFFAQTRRAAWAALTCGTLLLLLIVLVVAPPRAIDPWWTATAVRLGIGSAGVWIAG